MSRRELGFAALLSLLIASCDEPPRERPPWALGDGAAGDPAGNQVDAAALPRTPAFAVISSDWSATSVSILDARGELLAPDYIHSGSTRTGLVSALSGDVELPTRSGEPGTLVLIDRFRTDVVTRIRLADGAVLGQVKTHTPPPQGARYTFSSNPHDYLYIDEHTAWVTRSEPNLDPSAPESERGSDLLRLDPSTMTRTSERIDLSSLDLRVADPRGADREVTLHARPTRMVQRAGRLLVGIGRTSFDFAQVGPGVVAAIDLVRRVVTPVELDGLANCTGLSEVPDDPSAVLVACHGDYTGKVIERAGLVLLRIVDDVVLVAARAPAAADAVPLTSFAISLGQTWALAAANDYRGRGADVLAMVDLATGERRDVLRVEPGSGRFGTPAYDAVSGLLLVPDATLDGSGRPTAGVRRFQRQRDGSFVELPATKALSQTGMPVRHVYPL